MCADAAITLEHALSREVATYRTATFADGTKRTYMTHRNAYYQFCKEMNIPPVPVSETTLTYYAAYLARRLKPASVRQYLNVVRIMHLECGFDNPAKDSWFLRTTLKGIDRIKGTAVVRKSPITPAILLRIKQQLDLTVRDNIVFWAACLIMFFGLFRKSNLFATRGQFDPNKQFTRNDFSLNSDRSLTIEVRWSKTIQYRERKQVVNLPVLHPHPLCPVSALCRALHTSPAQPGTAQAFPLSSSQFDRKLKTAVGGEQGHITSHSFRRGGAVQCLAAGVPGEVVKLMGDWKSTAYLAYLDNLPQDMINYYRILFSQSLP